MNAQNPFSPTFGALLAILLQLPAKKVNYSSMQKMPFMLDFTFCPLACTNGDVRLSGGHFDNEGTVEVCYSGLWGLVADSGWTNGDARVVCNQLGYTEGSM